eukprot:6809259-Prymnesium_polylepis.2
MRGHHAGTIQGDSILDQPIARSAPSGLLRPPPPPSAPPLRLRGLPSPVPLPTARGPARRRAGGATRERTTPSSAWTPPPRR